jgi:hypothetical protein
MKLNEYVSGMNESQHIKNGKTKYFHPTHEETKNKHTSEATCSTVVLELHHRFGKVGSRYLFGAL